MGTTRDQPVIILQPIVSHGQTERAVSVSIGAEEECSDRFRGYIVFTTPIHFPFHKPQSLVPGPRWDTRMAPPLLPDPQLWGSPVPDFQDIFARSLASLVALFFALSALPGRVLPSIKYSGVSDPCAAIASKQWVAPSDVRACFTSFQVDPAEKANVGDDYS